MVDSQLNSDNNMVNLYYSRLKECRLEEKINDEREKLKEWHDECYKTIDKYYERKLEELDEYRRKYEEKKTKIHANILPLTTEEKNDSIEQDLNDLERTSLQVHCQSLKLNENLISIEQEFNVENFKQDPSTSYLYTQDSSSAIASNQQYLLMHQCEHLILINQDLKIVKKKLWSNGWIRDMCWSKKIQVFIIITSNSIYFVNENLEYFTPEQESVKQDWFSSTCSEESLYLSTCQWGSAVFELSLSSPIVLIKQWKPPATCEEHEGINDIKCNNETLALMIQNPKERQKRMVLKSIKTFETKWSFPLIIGNNYIRLFTCCPINNNQWLVIDGTNSHIYHITEDGKFIKNIQYPSVPYRANLFNSNILAISAETYADLYQISN